MFIKSLQLNNFKRFKKLKIDFPGDITVIKGHNEQGKSTILEGLLAAFFYDPGKSNELIKSGKAWGSEKMYSTNLEFEVDGVDYVLTKDFEAKSTVLRNIESGDEITEYKKVMALLGRVGGYQTPELFLSTACVKQGELAVLDRKQTITEALGDIVSSAGSSVSLLSILKRIEKARDELRRGVDRGMAKNPGKILRLSNEKSEKESELARKKKVFEEEDVYRRQLGQLRAGLEKNQSNLELKERSYNEGVEYFMAKKNLDNINVEYDKTCKITKSVEKLKEDTAELRSSAELLDCFKDVDVKKFLDRQARLNEQKERINILDKQIKDMKSKGHKFENVFDKRYLLVLGTLAFLGLAGFFIHKAFFASWGVLGISVIGIFVFKIFTIRVSLKKMEKELSKEERENKASAGELAGELGELKVSSIDEIESEKNKLRDTLGKIEVLESKLEGLLSDETLESLLQKKQELEKRIGVEEQKLEGLKRGEPPTREEQISLERDLESLRKKVREADREITGIEAVLANSKASREEIVILEERVYELSEELKRASRKEQALALLGESLLEAQQKTFASTRKILEQYIGEFLSEITEGKYSSVSIGRGMKIKVFSSEKDEEVEPQKNLSHGAVEQLYLVARFALISLLYGSNKEQSSPRPLVVLDDPFVNFDASRRAQTRHITRKLAQKFQIVLLTCSNQYDKWGKVIDLADAK